MDGVMGVAGTARTSFGLLRSWTALSGLKYFILKWWLAWCSSVALLKSVLCKLGVRQKASSKTLRPEWEFIVVLQGSKQKSVKPSHEIICNPDPPFLGRIRKIQLPLFSVFLLQYLTLHPQDIKKTWCPTNHRPVAGLGALGFILLCNSNRHRRRRYVVYRIPSETGSEWTKGEFAVRSWLYISLQPKWEFRKNLEETALLETTEVSKSSQIKCWTQLGWEVIRCSHQI